MSTEKPALPLVSLRGRWTILRPIVASDYDELYRWRVDIRDSALWMGIGRAVPVFDAFVQEMRAWSSSGISMLAIDAERSRPFALRRAHNMDVLNGWAYSQTYVIPEYRMRPYAAEAVFLFDDYLFKYFPFRKIYVEVFEFDKDFLGVLRRLSLKEEGGFSDHIWFDHRYWDVRLFSMSRLQWQDLAERWNTILEIENDISKLQDAVALNAKPTD